MEGTSGDGRLRDALAPQAAGWLTSVGAVPAASARFPTTTSATVDAIQELGRGPGDDDGRHCPRPC